MLCLPHLLLWLVFVSNYVVAVDVVVSSTDSRIKYQGQWTDQDNGGHQFAGSGASASFTFSGTAIKWLGAKNPNGCKTIVDVDGEETTVDAAEGTQKTDSPVPATLYTKSGLDGSKEHTISLRFGGVGTWGGPYMELYGFIYSDPNAQSSGSLSLTTTASSIPSASTILSVSGGSTVTITVGSSQSPTSSQSSDHGGGSKTVLIGAVVGGVIGGVVGAILLVLLAICVMRRRRAKKEKAAKDAERTPEPFRSRFALPPLSEKGRTESEYSNSLPSGSGGPSSGRQQSVQTQSVIVSSDVQTASERSPVRQAPASPTNSMTQTSPINSVSLPTPTTHLASMSILQRPESDGASSSHRDGPISVAAVISEEPTQSAGQPRARRSEKGRSPTSVRQEDDGTTESAAAPDAIASREVAGQAADPVQANVRSLPVPGAGRPMSMQTLDPPPLYSERAP